MHKQRVILIVAIVLGVGYARLGGAFVGFGSATLVAGQPSSRPGLQKAIFAAGCFWCVESDFDKLSGVVSTTSGYIGGRVANPTYEQVSAGGTGHVEAVEIQFDPAVVTYEQLLDHFWHNVDPFAANRQSATSGPNI